MTITQWAGVILGTFLVGYGLALLVAHMLTRMAETGRAVERLADPARCPDCGHKLAAGEDVITPHDCPEEDR